MCSAIFLAFIVTSSMNCRMNWRRLGIERTMREAAKQIDAFLQRYEFNSKDQLNLR